MRGRAVGLSWLVASVVACGSEVTQPAGSGGASVGGDGGAGATSSSSSGGFDGGPVGKPCPPEACDGPGVTCLHPDGLCGAGSPGICTDANDCGMFLSGAVCGCDGAIYDSACEAQAAGVDPAKSNACPTPAGHFPCLESTYCDVATEHCLANVGFAVSVGCAPLPPACDPAQGGVLDCSCVDPMSCDLASCEITSEGGLSIVCHSPP